MAVEVHALVENAHDVDVESGLPVEEEVRADRELEIARANVIAGATTARMGGGGLDPALDVPQISLGLIYAPPLSAIGPDTFKVLASQG
ncbi:MAG: hypothetical protein Q7J39_18835 [Phenylobacterium sp.]|nr:hypothetical protein [Phenylobacterium sp.]MDO8802393.1 hypothetical protein [Phenylobacterium sp.]